MASSLNPIPSFISSAVGGTAFLRMRDELQRRGSKALDVISAYQGDAFSKMAFQLFLNAAQALVFLLYAAVMALGVFVLLCAVPALKAVLAPHFLTSTGTNWTDDVHLQILSVVGLVAALITFALELLEPRMTFDFLRHWSSRTEIERRLASRIKDKREKREGYFRIDRPACEKVATGLLDRIAADPQWLLGALLPTHSEKPTLANELMLGTMCETVMYRTFAPRWDAFAPIQHMRDNNGNALASPAAIQSLSPVDYAGAFRTGFGALNLTARLLSAIEENAGILRRRYGGSVLNLVQPSMPGIRVPFGLLLALLLLSVHRVRSALILAAASKLGPEWATLLLNAGSIGCVAVLLVVVYRSRRGWVDWVLTRARFATDFERVIRHLEELKIFRMDKVARVAFAKFLFEYGLLRCEGRELVLGQANPIRLALLKTGAVWSNAKTLAADDPDLDYFCDLAMRAIADELENGVKTLLATRPQALDALNIRSTADLTGERYPYNIVDGSLYLVGSEACSKNACDTALDDCPLRSQGVCQGEKGWRLSKTAQQFVRD